MGKWLRKVGRFADKVVDKVQDEVEDKWDDIDFGCIETLLARARQCAATARETVQICDDTVAKRDQMIAFGSDISTTLRGLSSDNNEGGGHDASIVETIQQLTAGDKVAAALELAQGLDVVALSCVEKSVLMIDCMEEGLDSLPDVLQRAIERRASEQQQEEADQGNRDAQELVHGLDRDLADVQTCIDSLLHLNLTTAFKVGLEAFTQLADKAQRSKSMFDSVRGFAVDVQEIVDAFSDMKPRAVVAQSKDLLRCIGLSDTMRLIAEGAGKLLRMIVQLFKATADRISVLWSALAYAKECVADCLQYVHEAKTLCLDTQAKSMSLIAKSKSVQDQLEKIGEVNMGSVRAIQSLSRGGGEMKEAIDLARNMDNLVLECIKKFIAMVERVDQGFRNLPEILTQGIDGSAAGSGRDEDPEPANVEKDISELEVARQAIETSDIVSAAKAGVRGFNGVSEKAAVCKDMLGLVEQFAGNCDATITNFMSVWDIESAGNKITEMLQLLNLSNMMKHFADQIQRLLVTIIALIKASIDKFTKGFADIGEALGDVGETLDHVKDKIGDKLDDTIDDVTDKLQFWK